LKDALSVLWTEDVLSVRLRKHPIITDHSVLTCSKDANLIQTSTRLEITTNGPAQNASKDTLEHPLDNVKRFHSPTVEQPWSTQMIMLLDAKNASSPTSLTQEETV